MSTAAANVPSHRRMLVGDVLASRMGSGTAYRAATQYERQVAMWRPPLRSADAEILRDAAKVRARARDLYRNHPYAKQAVRMAALAVVGKKLRFSTRVDHKFLGINVEEADRWGAEFDRLWEIYAHGEGAWCDAGRRGSFSALMRLAARTRMVDGEVLGTLEWYPERRWRTSLQIVDVDRLSNPDGAPDTSYLKGGVALDDGSAPVGYWIRDGHPADLGVDAATRSMHWSYVPRETAWGRPVVSHSFVQERAGQTRGISDFTTVILSMRQEQEFADADLASAIMQAMYALVIKSNMDHTKAMEVLGAEVEVDENGNPVNPMTGLMLDQLAVAAAYHNEAKIAGFDGGRIPHLMIGEELQLVTPGNKGSNAIEFSKAAVKKFSAGLGGEPISIGQDFSDVNYSSARMSVANNWRTHEITRGDLVYDVGLPLVRAFMEEVLHAEVLPLPKGVAPADLYEALPALAKGQFLSSGPPMLDPVKERQGQQLGWAIGLDTLEEMAAEEGEDWREKVVQKGREIAFMRANGVPIPGEPVVPAADAASGGDGGDA